MVDPDWLLISHWPRGFLFGRIFLRGEPIETSRIIFWRSFRLFLMSSQRGNLVSFDSLPLRWTTIFWIKMGTWGQTWRAEREDEPCSAFHNYVHCRTWGHLRTVLEWNPKVIGHSEVRSFSAILTWWFDHKFRRVADFWKSWISFFVWKRGSSEATAVIFQGFLTFSWFKHQSSALVTGLYRSEVLGQSIRT